MSAPPHPRAAAWSVYAVVAAAWLATRLIALVSVDLTPWMLNDLDIYAAWLPHLQGGAFPVGDPTWQYPPGSAPVFLLAGLIPADFRWSFTLVALAADATIMVALITAHVRRVGASWRGLWLWALAGIVVGPIMLVRFDLVPTLFAVVAVLLVARPVLSGMTAALGLTVKVWPALMLFVLPRRSLPKGLVGFVAMAAAVLAGFALVTDNSLSFVGNQQARGLQVESVGALPYEIYSLAGGNVSFGLKYGSIQVLMEGAELVGLLLTVLGLGLFALLAWARLSGRLDSAPPGDVALAVMLVAVATSRVYSPQFNVWLVGIAAVAMIDAESRQRIAVALVIAVSILTQVVYPWSATQLVTGGPVAIVAQSLRIAGLLAALVLSLMAVLRRRRTPLTSPTQMVG